MIKSSFDTPSFEKVFIRQALFESSVRLDGRGVSDYRDVSVQLSRTEKSSMSEVQIGDTLVVSIVTGDIVTPYPDRPTDGILQFNADVSSLAENFGFLHSDLSRLLERAIRESDTIDTESLCIIGGEKVWMITCEVKVLDGSGGNIADACMFSAMSALRAFRKPETSVVSDDVDVSLESGIIVHHSDDREPLPLSLHHTPLSVTLGVFKNTLVPVTVGENNSSSSSETHSRKDKAVILITDPTLQEETAMDGKITFSINAHRELCALTKPGGVALSSSVIVKAAQTAARRAIALHDKLAIALSDLESTVIAEREKRQELMRLHSVFNLEEQQRRLGGVVMDSGEGADSSGVSAYVTVGGIDRNDPILAWSSLHQAAGLWNEPSK